MKKVLIITYYWPPSGGGGVLRWLKFTKYLRSYGWEPIIYTPENPEAPAIDHSLGKDIPEDLTVLRTKIWEPYTLYKYFSGKKKADKINTGFLSEKKSPSLLENAAIWIRSNLFIPDARKFWIKPSVRFLVDYLKKNPVDAIVSSGPPHSMHLIALGLSKRTGLPWLADFRDPWSNIDYYHHLKLTRLSDAKHKKLEKQVLKNASKLVTVSWNWAEDFRKLGANEVEVITNGFDEDDFKNFERQPNPHFELLHLGSINKDRNPSMLWKVLGELCAESELFRKKLKITLIGQSDFVVFEEIKKNLLWDNFNKVDYLPHNQALSRGASATVLLLPLNDTPNVMGIIPGKLFEYLALKRPVLGIGPVNGDSARIINQCKAGKTISFDDEVGLKSFLYDMFIKFDRNEDEIEEGVYKQYERKQLTLKITELLNEITSNERQQA